MPRSARLSVTAALIARLSDFETSQFAHLAAIPFAHVDQMAIHLAAPLADESFLLLQLLRLLGQPCRRMGDLLRLLVDLAGPSFQPRLIQVQRLL